ncbi:sel1 repeat family protein [Phyllobacterium endophyticum]|nr:sel1 repeat family protein [Phyllobacterium endophyticum]
MPFLFRCELMGSVARWILMWIAILSATTTFAYASDARDAYERGEFVRALNLWQPLAERGDAEAQMNLGAMFYHGIGTIVDKAEAFKWYRKAAEQGDSRAQATIGTAYYTGNVVTTEKGEAFKWYFKAALQGEPESQSMVARMYHSGDGVLQDRSEAIKWFKRLQSKASQWLRPALDSCTGTETLSHPTAHKRLSGSPKPPTQVSRVHKAR